MFRENKNILTFFKTRPHVITIDNLHDSVFVSSIVESPITTLYHILQKLFAPVLVKVKHS